MNAQGKRLEVDLELEQCALVLQALSEKPFKLVFELIGRINGQAHRCFAREGAEAELGRITLAAAELDLCMEALEQLPYSRVKELMAILQAAAASGGATGGGDGAI